MKDIRKIINESDFDNDNLYLLEKISDEYGFFYQNGIIYFARKSNNQNEDISIETQFLDMNLYVYLKNISGNASFEDGYFDLLAFKGDIDSIYFESFCNICNSYVIDPQGMSFSEFFNNLVDLFQIDKDTNFTNLIGLIGELLIIKYVYEKYGKTISPDWHKNGDRSKFDFSFKDFNIEIKTTVKNESKFRIKHNQIFNNQNNYITVVNLIETGVGYSLSSLYEYFKNENVFATDITFQIKLTKEMFKYPRIKDRKRSFVIDDIQSYFVNDMETIAYYPICISNIVYDYDFSETPTSDVFLKL